MLPEDIDREFREIKLRMGNASKLAQSARFEEAATEYELLVEMMETTRSDRDAELMICIQGLADCYLTLHRYTTAAGLYLRLLNAQKSIEGGPPEDLVLTLFKSAKCNEKSNRAKSADSLYAEALQAAETTLPQGHLLSSNIMESYAAFLKKTNTRLNQAAELLERAHANMEAPNASSHEISDHILDSLGVGGAHEGTSGQTKKRGARFHRLKEPQAASSRQLVEKVRMPILLLLIFLGLATFLFYTFKRVDSITKMQADSTPQRFEIQFYQSADGLKSLKLISNDRAELTMGAKTMTVHCVKANKLVPILNAHSLLFEGHGDNLIDADGCVLYKNLPTPVRAANKLAEIANQMFMSGGEYPQDLEALAPAIAGISELQNAKVSITYLGSEGSLRDQTSRGRIESGLSVPNDEVPEPDAVHAYYGLSKTGVRDMKATSFMVRAFDHDGSCFTSSIRRFKFCRFLQNGKDVTLDTLQDALKEQDDLDKLNDHYVVEIARP